ncbi:MAG TPA: hypothetical protein PKM07_09320, partial [Spirochaetota bacterium]|nr:hypothetical protein [Spirochaetota bacterium]
INMPIAVLTGDNSRGAYITSDVSREISDLNSGAQIVNISAGHSIRRDAFDDYVKALETFIQKINQK